MRDIELTFGDNDSQGILAQPIDQYGLDVSFDEFLDGCRDYLLKVAGNQMNAKLRSKIGESDVVQDVLLSAQKHRDTFRGKDREEFLRWIRSILLNRIVTVNRCFESKRRQIDREVSLDQQDISAETKSPSSIAIFNETSTLLLETLERLPARYQNIITMRQKERLPFSEVAARLNISNDAARKLWGRAIQSLSREFRSRQEPTE